uniref:DUF3450 domain-containing protein n=1 Tax=Thaumasiovibrio occultus TaxID=1891184 RepID=UPI00131CE414|nr:DUF3450 domain-containing protein [Thaumasiovibrio occultus]
MTAKLHIVAASIMGLATALSATSLSAASLDSAQRVEATNQQEGIVTQQRIDVSAENALDFRADIVRLEQEIAELTIYRDHLQTLTEDQALELTNIDQQLVEVKETRRGIVPLMYNMLAELKDHINADRPIQRSQRLARVERLEQMMGQSDIAEGEKFRRLLEAWQIEMDYGIKLGAYRDNVTIDGVEREAELVNLGRAVLVARSADKANYWSWNDSAKDWQAIDSADIPDIELAFALSQKATTPAILNLPVSLSANVETPNSTIEGAQ